MTHVFHRIMLGFALVAVGILTAPGAYADSLAVSTDRFSYDGVVNVYDTLADAQAGTNALGGPYDIPSYTSGGTTYDGRDLGLFIVQDAGYYWTDANIFLTAWYYTTNQSGAAYSGSGNPNNTNTGFLQMYDADSSTETALTGGWNSALNEFVLYLAGVNATYPSTSDPQDYARLWPAPTLGGAGSISAGTFHTYEFALTATFANTATLNGAGLYEINEDPTSVLGHISGIFENSTDGNFYVFNYTLSMENWAFDQGNTALNGDLTPSYFAGGVVPEPMTLSILGIGLSGMAFSALRARRRQ